jgi:hypothetical protein
MKHLKALKLTGCQEQPMYLIQMQKLFKKPFDSSLEHTMIQNMTDSDYSTGKTTPYILCSVRWGYVKFH